MTRLDGLLVARDRRRRDDHGISAFDGDGLVVTVGHARECRERLALAAGTHHDDLLGRESVRIESVDDVLVVDLQVAEFAGDLGVGDHRAAGDDDLAVGRDRRVADLLDAVDVAGERRRDHALVGVLDDVAQRGSH